MQGSGIRVKSSLLVILLVMNFPVQAQKVVNLWPGIAPGSELWKQKEVVVRSTPVGEVAINIVTPTLTAYLPEPGKATGVGIIIAPGGYCVALALGQGGNDVAHWLQQRGIAAFVLKYRTQEKLQQGIPQDLDMDQACKYGIADGIQALKIVRLHSREWGILPGHIGMIGFSAGGMVTSGTLLQEDGAARPDFVALLYGAPFGAMPSIPTKLPPIFMAWAQDDDVGRVAVVKFYEALLSAGDRPEAHIYQKGGHGFSIKKQGTTSDHWTEDLIDWIQANGFLLRPNEDAKRQVRSEDRDSNTTRELVKLGKLSSSAGATNPHQAR
jgi:acetyl esterase/lipase